MFSAKVLAIDDEPGVRAFLQRVLETRYSVALAADGEEGLKLAASWKPDLVLLDLRLPGLTGLEVLSKLRVGKETCNIPVVVVSMKGETDVLIECQRAGAADHVIKPFSAEDLLKVVARQLSGF